MLCAFGFQQIGVLLSDVYVDDPRPSHGQLGTEHGVRLELRVLERDELKGSQYSAQPISVGQPIWRVDLLETVAGEPGSFDRTHHHPAFTGWEPGHRVFVRELSADPIAWLASKLSDLPEVLKEAGVSADVAGPDDAEELRRAVPDILDTTERMLGRVHSGELGRPRPAIPAATYGPAGFSGVVPMDPAAALRREQVGGPGAVTRRRPGRRGHRHCSHSAIFDARSPHFPGRCRLWRPATP